MIEHSPEPWEVTEEGRVIVGADRGPIAIVRKRFGAEADGNGLDAEGRANVRLFVEAPSTRRKLDQLLAAAEAVLKWYDEQPDELDEDRV